MTEDEGWYAGTSYDRYVKHAKSVLENLEDNLPGYKGQGYELALNGSMMDFLKDDARRIER